MLYHLAGGWLTYYAGVAIVALPGLIGVLLMGRLHRLALNHCQRLEDEIVRAEAATEKARSLLSDVAATMNLSLAFSANASGEGHRESLEALRTAVQQTVWGEEPGRRATSSPAPGSEATG
jgi:hypothetical protein